MFIYSSEPRLKVSFVTLLLILSKKFRFSIRVQLIGTGEEQILVIAVATNNGPIYEDYCM
jgi:hypothetical protein